jgi:hypothetical protein
MAARPPWSKASGPMPPWGAPQYPSPYMGEYSTGDGAGEGQVLATNNAAFAGPASDVAPRRTAFHRGAMGAAEALGARLSITPSAKIPQNDPASGLLMSSTRLVKSRVGRSRGTFDAGAYGG